MSNYTVTQDCVASGCTSGGAKQIAGSRLIQVIAPREITRGVLFDFTVRVSDQDGCSLTDYTGSLSLVGQGAPINFSQSIYNFSPSDRGEHTFSARVDVSSVPVRIIAIESGSQTWGASELIWVREPAPIAPQPTPLPSVVRPLDTRPDLDVGYISREPVYPKYEVWYNDGKPYLQPGTEGDKRWPDPGEVVTFTAHIFNKGQSISGEFDFRWLIDDQTVASGTHPSLAPQEESTEIYNWPWQHTLDGERLLGAHTVKFEVDPDNLIAEANGTFYCS
jgi:hypothetical protein